MSILRFLKLTGGFVVVLFVLGLFSCSKNSDETSNKETNSNANGDAELVEVSESDFKETNEDLLTVDYKEFYNELAPHGEWIEVTDKDLGIDLKQSAGLSPVRKHRSISVSDFFGVKEAHALDADFGAFFVWKPAPNLAVGLTAGETEAVPVYQPYSNGQWMYTDAGWYFRAATPVEEVTHHYGRWVYAPAAGGWVWMPGRVWAPAWVDWREDDTYLAWTPIPPTVYIVNETVVVPPPLIVEERYVVVEKRYFVEPVVYKYMYKEHKGKLKIKEWRRLDGVMVVNNTVIDRGPDITVIRNVTGKDITQVQVNKVNSVSKVKVTDKEVYTYAPTFKKVNDKASRKNSVTKPEKFNSFGSVNKDSKSNNESSGKTDNSGKNDNSNSQNKTRLSDDKDMKNGKNNQNKGSDDKVKGKENRGNDDKGNNKGNNKGNDNKGKDNKGSDNKGNDNKGNDKSKGKDKNPGGNDNRSKGNDNKGSDNKGNDGKGNDKGGKDRGGDKKGKK